MGASAAVAGPPAMAKQIVATAARMILWRGGIVFSPVRNHRSATCRWRMKPRRRAPDVRRHPLQRPDSPGRIGNVNNAEHGARKDFACCSSAGSSAAGSCSTVRSNPAAKAMPALSVPYADAPRLAAGRRSRQHRGMSDPRPSATPDPFARDVYTVSRLNLDARVLLEEAFSTLWIEGEISNLARPRSGHLYFSLKDEHCQVRCAMFRMHNRSLAFEPENGLHVLASAKVSLYPERGEFQLIVQYMEEAGAGALRRAFDALKNRLRAEGLFDPANKRPIPTLPRCVGVVTLPDRRGGARRPERARPALPRRTGHAPSGGGAGRRGGGGDRAHDRPRVRARRMRRADPRPRRGGLSKTSGRSTKRRWLARCTVRRSPS